MVAPVSSSKSASGRWVKKIVSWMALLWACLVLASHVKSLVAGHFESLNFFVIYLIYAVLFAIRKPSKDEVTGLRHWTIALLGSWLPLFFQSLPPHYNQFTLVGEILQAIGTTYFIGAILSLWRSFGIFAAYREIKTHGLYRLVRHPLYSSEVIGFIGAILVNFSLFNVGLLLVQLTCQILRIRDEEALLRQDPTYTDYCTRVRWRLIPGIY